ncbi:hypothetical protein Ocin01_03197, partial [Orchesella cincta]
MVLFCGGIKAAIFPNRTSFIFQLNNIAQSSNSKKQNLFFNMNPLTILPLLALAMAAPGVQVLQSGVLAPGAVTYTSGSLLAQTVQVPLTKTVHYENRPVVTGYQTSVIKPAIASAPVISGYNPAYLRQLPELTPPPPPADLPTFAPINGTNPPADFPQPTPPADFPTPIPGLTPPTTTAAPGGENTNGSSSDQGGQQPQIPIPGSPIVVGGGSLLNTNLFQLPLSVVPQSVVLQQQAIAQPAADAIVVEARSAVPVAPAVQVAQVRAAQAGDFEPLVTKEKVLAPVRAHTQITPQVTQIQPEVTVRRVIQEVPVAQPVAVQTPVIQQYSIQ